MARTKASQRDTSVYVVDQQGFQSIMRLIEHFTGPPMPEEDGRRYRMIGRFNGKPVLLLRE